MTDAAAGSPRPARAPAPKGWAAVVLAFVTVLVVTLGGYVVAGAVPGEPSEPGGGPDAVEVSPTLTVAVEPGWSVVRQEAAGVVLSNGSGLLEVYPAPAPYDDAMRLLADYVRDVLRPAASQVTIGDAAPTSVRPADASVRAPYQGTFPAFGYPLEGAVTAVVTASGSAVIFDASAPQGQLFTVIDAIERMIAGSTIT